MNPSHRPLTMGKYLEKTWSFNLGQVTNLGEKLLIQTSCTSLKNLSCVSSFLWQRVSVNTYSIYQFAYKISKNKNENNISKLSLVMLTLQYINKNCPSIVLQSGARGVVVIAEGNEHGDTSSNPGRYWLHFT